MTVETHTSPPEPDVDGDDEDQPSARISIGILTVEDAHYSADVQIWGDEASDPEWFASALLRASLGLAAHIGPDHYWAVQRRFAAFDGTATR